VSHPATIEIGRRRLGPGEPVYVIAEAGSNHNRDIGMARELIDVAADAGCDAVKFQTYSGKAIYSRRTPQFEQMKAYTTETPAELLERIALPREWQAELCEHARSRGIDWFSSPFDHEAVRELAELGVPLMKIASFEIVDLPLIRAAAATGTPLIISTGMATMEEVGEALEAAAEAGASGVGLMQCTSVYPAPADRMNLRAMATMRDAFGVPVGLSDHTTGIGVAAAAAALGAAFIEKHFTLDRTLTGPDHSFAVEPAELAALVRGVREATVALGDGSKDGPSDIEAGESFVLGRRSLILTRDVSAGSVLSRDMLTVKRPGWGIKPKHLDEVVGRELKVDAGEDDILTWEML
jgi:sialic acid synthase SpsE